MLAVCPETDIENQLSVSISRRWNPQKKKPGFLRPGLFRSRPPYPGMILPSAASKKQHEKATKD
jgi:hypothetical protein